MPDEENTFHFSEKDREPIFTLQELQDEVSKTGKRREHVNKCFIIIVCAFLGALDGARNGSWISIIVSVAGAIALLGCLLNAIFYMIEYVLKERDDEKYWVPLIWMVLVSSLLGGLVGSWISENSAKTQQALYDEVYDEIYTEAYNEGYEEGYYWGVEDMMNDNAKHMPN
jgi:hypothetical protein